MRTAVLLEANIMRVAVLIVAFVFCAGPAGIAQRGGPQFGGGGSAQYAGYAFAECTASNTPAVRLVLIQGLVPAGLPASAPRPSLALILTGAPDAIVGKEIALSKDAAGPGRILSCPVVGDCVPAETGAVTIEKRGEDGAFTGQFRATWPPIPQRSGQFTVGWRDSGKTCG
jgi:hypothetical protein